MPWQFPSASLLRFDAIVEAAVGSILETAGSMPDPDAEGLLLLARKVAENADARTAWEEIRDAAAELRPDDVGKDPPPYWCDAFACVIYDRAFEALRALGYLV